MLAANFIIKAFAWIFIAALDWVAYMLLSVAYTIFVAVSQLDIFSTEAGGTVYNEICSRFYSALSVIMIFVFAYFLIMMIVDPDGGAKKASTQMVKDVVFSLVLVIVLPTIFGYMSLFQKHVLTNNTIGALILGGKGTIDNNPGKQISMIVFTAFFHPQGTIYADYFDDDGKFIGKDQGMTVCRGPHDIGEKDSSGNTVEVSTDDDVCEAWVEGLEAWEKSDPIVGIGPISSRSKLRDTVGDEGGMEYMWILSTVAAIAVAYFFFSYTLDIGTRAVKLGFLQLIAPAPVMLKMFPQTKKTFDAWFAELKKCYLEIFFRVAVIFFIVKLCTMVPIFISAIFGGTSSVEGGFLLKAIATVCLILGLLKFAKEAPELLKTIFSSASGGLLAGIDFKPGVKRRISENEYAMKGMSAVTGAVGGAIGAGAMAYRNSLENSNIQGNGDHASRLKAFGSGLLASPRGLISGGKTGFKNTPQEFGAKNMGGVFNQGAAGGQSSYVHHENNKLFNIGQAMQAAEGGADTKEKVKLFGQSLHDQVSPKAQAYFDDVGEAWHNQGDLMFGRKANAAAASGTISTSTKSISDVLDMAKSKSKPYTDASDAMVKDVLTKGMAQDLEGVTVTRNGGYVHSKYEEALKKAGTSGVFSMADYEKECAAKGVPPKSSITGQYYNPRTGNYESTFNPNSYITSRANDKFNPATGKYESTYDPKTDQAFSSISIADAKKKFTEEANKEMAKAFSDKYRSGVATMMATLREQLSKEGGNLGPEGNAALLKEVQKITKTMPDGSKQPVYESVDAFLKHLSDKNSTISGEDVSALKGMQSALEDQGKNISIQTQLAQQQANQRKNGGKQGSGDKK